MIKRNNWINYILLTMVYIRILGIIGKRINSMKFGKITSIFQYFSESGRPKPLYWRWYQINDVYTSISTINLFQEKTLNVITWLKAEALLNMSLMFVTWATFQEPMSSWNKNHANSEWNYLVERRGSLEHATHVCNLSDIPRTNVLMK